MQRSSAFADFLLRKRFDSDRLECGVCLRLSERSRDSDSIAGICKLAVVGISTLRRTAHRDSGPRLQAAGAENRFPGTMATGEVSAHLAHHASGYSGTDGAGR